MTLYTIGRSTRNTLKVEVEGGMYRCTLTENGGQYNRLCIDVRAVVEYLGQMWGFTALTEMPYSELLKRVQSKLKLKTGTCLFA